MQRVAGQYVVKRFTEQILGNGEQQNQQAGQEQAPGQPAPQVAGQPAPVQVGGGELHGTMIYDDEGNRLGVARHVEDVSVYVISHGTGELNRNLQTTLNDPEMELRISTDANGRINGLIYVPSSARAALNIAGTRLDDV